MFIRGWAGKRLQTVGMLRSSSKLCLNPLICLCRCHYIQNIDVSASFLVKGHSFPRSKHLSEWSSFFGFCSNFYFTRIRNAGFQSILFFYGRTSINIDLTQKHFLSHVYTNMLPHLLVLNFNVRSTAEAIELGTTIQESNALPLNYSPVQS